MKTNAKNNCDNFIDLVDTRLCIAVGDWQPAAYFTGGGGGVVFSGCDPRSPIVTMHHACT